jgi:hypothetical protein
MMDLLGLVVGFALFFALRQPRPPAVIRLASGRTVADWVEWTAGRAITATAVVLLPVVLIRRTLDRDAPRPAEWFLIVVGSLQLAAGLGYLREVLYWRLLARVDGAVALGPLLVRITPEGIGAVAALVTFVGLAVFRRSLPPWARASTLVLILVLLFWGPVPGLAWELKFAITSALLDGSQPTVLLRILAPGVAGLPEGLLLALPAVAMLRDGRRAGLRGRRRLEWVGLGLLAAIVAAWAFDLVAEVAMRPIAPGLTTLDMLVYSAGRRAWIVPTLLIAWYLVGRFGADFDKLMSPVPPREGRTTTTANGS